MHWKVRVGPATFDQNAQHQAGGAPHPKCALPRIEGLSGDGTDELRDDEGSCEAADRGEHRASAVGGQGKGVHKDVSEQGKRYYQTYPSAVEQHLEVCAMRIVRPPFVWLPRD